MRIAWLEPVGGLSGDMLLGALVDVGLPLETLQRTVDALSLEGVRVSAERVSKVGIAATKVGVHAQAHHHGDHGHHGGSARELMQIVQAGDLPQADRTRAADVIRRLAEAEAKIHDTTPDEVHFHELGGLDTVVDVCGAVVGLRELGIGRLHCAPLPLGHGFVDCAHGRLPLPAPATAELLRGVPTVGIDIEGETVTPTGAALAVMLADEIGARPALVADVVGYGAGNADFDPVPNVVRLTVGEETGPTEVGEVVVIEANVDDMSGELVPHALQAALQAGALDAWAAPIVMKKGRPALTISALAEPAAVDAVAESLLRETTSLGVRMSRWSRRCLPRESVTVQTPYGEVSVKVGYLDGEMVTASPEHDDCVRAAERAGVTLKQVYAAAVAALASRG